MKAGFRRTELLMAECEMKIFAHFNLTGTMRDSFKIDDGMPRKQKFTRYGRHSETATLTRRDRDKHSDWGGMSDKNSGGVRD